MRDSQRTKLFVIDNIVINGWDAGEETALEEAGFPQANPEQRKKWEDSRARHGDMRAEPHRWIARLA
jgi:hypothetical protein